MSDLVPIAKSILNSLPTTRVELLAFKYQAEIDRDSIIEQIDRAVYKETHDNAPYDRAWMSKVKFAEKTKQITIKLITERLREMDTTASETCISAENPKSFTIIIEKPKSTGRPKIEFATEFVKVAKDILSTTMFNKIEHIVLTRLK